MPSILIWGLVFILSLAVLIISADFFIKSSEKIGASLGIPSFIVGVTLVALGTSLPELITSIIAVMEGASEIVTGNVIGSNISNLCLILGVTGIYSRRVLLGFDIMRVDLPMLVGSSFFMGLCLWDQQFSLFEGILSLAALGMYLAYLFFLGKEEQEEPDQGDEGVRGHFDWKTPVILLASGAAIYFSAKYNVQSIQQLSSELGIGKDFIALTAVALGTSLPELVVSIVASRSGHTDMAVGNILGSNIFNTFAVMGVASSVGSLTITDLTAYSMPYMVAATLMAFFVLQDRLLTQWESWILIMLYVLFIFNIPGVAG